MEKREETGHKKPSLTARFTAWRKRHVSDSVTLVIVAAFIGTLAGFGAFLLKFFIGHITGFITSIIQETGHKYLLLIIPVVGIIAVSCYQRYILRQNLMHGTDRLNKDLKARRYRLPGDLTYAPMLASTVTLGLGGSAGAEGPIATTGAAIGSNLGRILGLSPSMIRILIGCGAGAGIAGIFKAPIGGALFTLEVLKMPMTTLSVLALIIASVCGSLMCYICTGFTPDVNFISVTPFAPSWVGWIVGLGLFCGIYSVYYSTVITRMGHFFSHLRNPWVMNIIGGGILAVSLFIFPILYGEGYSVVTDVVNGNFSGLTRGSVFEGLVTDNTALILMVGGVLLCKCWATVSSNSAGGVAGDFAPTIFAGAMAGFVYASAVNAIFDANLPVGIFALLGTAGVFSGAIHAPLMAMFLTAEMANGYGYFLGLVICAVLSYLTVKFFTPRSGYYKTDDLHALLHLKKQPPAD